MKVVEGNFGKDEEQPTLAESLSEVLRVSELAENNTGKFVLIVDTEERTTFMTNQRDPAGTVYLLEQIKNAIINGGVARYE